MHTQIYWGIVILGTEAIFLNCVYQVLGLSQPSLPTLSPNSTECDVPFDLCHERVFGDT